MGLWSATSPVAWLDFGMLLPFAGIPLGFAHCVQKGKPCPENPAQPWTVTRARCNTLIGITWVCGGYSVADVHGNGGDGDGDNQQEKSNKSGGPYDINESQWITKDTGQERSGMGWRSE